MWDEISRYIDIRDGTIVYQSILDKRNWFGLDRDRLLSCVEDNIIEGEDGESIDWPAVERDYKEPSHA